LTNGDAAEFKISYKYSNDSEVFDCEFYGSIDYEWKGKLKKSMKWIVNFVNLVFLRIWFTVWLNII